MFIKLLVSLTTNDIFVWFKKKKDLSAFKTQSSNNIMHKSLSGKKNYLSIYIKRKMYTFIYIFVFLEIVLILHINNFLNDK